MSITNRNNQMKFTLSVILTFTLLCLPNLLAQEKSETSPQHQHEEMGMVKEVDAFHELLHPLVHEAYPKNDFATIRKAIPELLKSGKSIKSAKLPAELEGKKDAYAKYSKKLVQQLTDLNKKKDKLSDKEFGSKFMEMHDTFESIVDIVG